MAADAPPPTRSEDAALPVQTPDSFRPPQIVQDACPHRRSGFSRRFRKIRCERDRSPENRFLGTRSQSP
jgi:hypothetical protein